MGELAAHKHWVADTTAGSTSSSGIHWDAGDLIVSGQGRIKEGTNYAWWANTDSKGGNAKHNNIQPYSATYYYQRTK